MSGPMGGYPGYGQDPQQNPYGNNPYGSNPYGSNPYGPDPNEQTQLGGFPAAGASYPGQAPGGYGQQNWGAPPPPPPPSGSGKTVAIVVGALVAVAAVVAAVVVILLNTGDDDNDSDDTVAGPTTSESGGDNTSRSRETDDTDSDERLIRNQVSGFFDDLTDGDFDSARDRVCTGREEALAVTERHERNFTEEIRFDADIESVDVDGDEATAKANLVRTRTSPSPTSLDGAGTLYTFQLRQTGSSWCLYDVDLNRRSSTTRPSY